MASHPPNPADGGDPAGNSAELPSLTFHVVTKSSQLPVEFLEPSAAKKLVIGFDCEGVDLCRHGALCVMQIAFPDAVYLVDAIEGGKELVEACKPALESDYITKVIHDCKRDSEALYFQFGIKLHNVMDTQIAYSLIEEQEGKKRAYDVYISFVSLLADPRYCGMPYPEKEEVRTLLRQDPNFWKSRPLSEMMIRAATDDVRFLLNIHEKMMEKLSKVSLWRLAVRSELYCRCFCINDNEQADWPPLPTIPDDIEAEVHVPEVDILSLLDVPTGKMGRVIGRKGSSIMAVKESCNVEIHIGGSKGPPDRVFIIGPMKEVRKAEAILRGRMLEFYSGAAATPLWPLLSPAGQNALKAHLLNALQSDPPKPIAKKVCDAISELATLLLPENTWAELLPFLFRAASTPEAPNLQESALLIFARLADYIAESLLDHLMTIHNLLASALAHPTSPDVRIAALSAAVNLVQCLPTNSDRDKMQDLLPAMMRALTDCLNSAQEASAQEALELLVELAGAEPRFLRRQIADVAGAMLQIAEAAQLEDGTRHLAVEFVITLAEARERAPGMMRRLPQFVGRLFQVLMQMLLDVEDEAAWHTAETEDEDAGEGNNYGVAQECLDRLAIAIGGNAVVPIASELLPQYLSAPEWQKHHAALITLAQIAEGCAKVMLKNLEQVVSMILNGFQHPHPRVRWAAINAIGQLSTDLGPDLQVQYHQKVLPALANAMDDFQNPRVQAHAASAILNFSENCTPEILTPYLDGIVGKLLVLLQNGKQMVQEGALTALASVADSSQDHFKKYYDAVMPYLKAILMNATDKSNRMLRAKSMECISLVGMAVGKDKFRDDAKQVMEVLMALQGTPMETDDPITSYMLQAWARLCKCLGQDFLPYMSVVMPPLLQSAQLKPDVTITSAESDDEIESDDDDSIETITLGDKRIGIRTSVLEEKATACNMLCCYADELKEGFYPWIDQVAPTLVPLLKFYFHEEVRRAAVAAMPELLRSAKLAVEKGQAQGRDESYVKQLSDFIIPALVEALHKEPETEMCSSMLDSLNECMQLSGRLLDENQVRAISDEIKNVIIASATRKRDRSERTKAEDFDADEGELLKEENEQEEEVFDQVGECLGTLIKTFKASFLPFFDELSVYVTPMLGKDKTAEERRIAICIFDDIAEQCRESALKYYDTYVPFLLEASNDDNSDVRQAAVYGLGVCAEFGGHTFRPLVGEALSKLNNLIRHPEAQHPDNIMAYDNAVSALGKICQFHRDGIDAAQVIPAWLGCLPIKDDKIEAKVVHDQLCSMVERSDSHVLGHLPKVYSIFVEVLSNGKELASDETTTRMINVLKRFQQTLPPDFLASTFSTLQPQQQLMLQSILST